MIATTVFPFYGRCSQMAWSPNGRYLAVLDLDNATVLIYDVEKKMRLPWMLFSQKHQANALQNVCSMAWSPNGKYLALGHDTGFVIVDPVTGSITSRATVSLRETQIASLAWSPSGKLVLTTGYSHQCFLYDVASHETQEPQAMQWPSTYASSFRAACVHGWLGSKKSRSVVVVSKNQSLLTADLSGKLETIFNDEFPISLSSCAVSPSGRHVALATSLTTRVHLCHLGRPQPGLRKAKIYQPEQPYYADHRDRGWYQDAFVAWSQDGKYLATSFGSLLRRIYIWNALTGMTHQVLETTQGEVTSLAWGPDNRLCWGEEGIFQICRVL